MIFSRNSDDGETVVGLIASALRRDISFGELPPDRRLKIEELRSAYGGSSHSMREALTLLSSEGLVEANAQRGFRVASATQADLEDITRMRCEIERLGLQWSMEQDDVAWEARVIAAHHTLSRASRSVQTEPMEGALAWDEAGREFHTALVSACGSPRLVATHARLYDQSRRFRLAALRENRIDFAAEAEIHSALLAAIVDRQADKAIELLTAEIESILNQ